MSWTEKRFKDLEGTTCFISFILIFLRDFLTDAPDDIVDDANDWVTEYTGAARRLNWDVDELRDSTDCEAADEVRPVLWNAMLWFRVAKATDTAEWEDDSALGEM